MTPTPPSKVVYIIVIAISILTMMGMGTLCAGMFFHVYADNSIMVAVISMTSTLSGSLTTLLIGRNMMQTPPQDITVTGTPPKVEVTQPEKKS